MRHWANRAAPRYVCALLLLALLLPQSGTPQAVMVASKLEQACSKEANQYCRVNRPEAPVEASCLRQYWISLSPACRSAVRAKSGRGNSSSTATE